SGNQTREENRALYLRARGACIPIDAPKIDAVDRHRQAISVFELEARAHIGQGLGDAFHRATTEAVVADEGRGERVRGDNAGQQAGCGTAVPAVERPPRRPERTQAPPAHTHRVGETAYFRAEARENSSS